MTEPIGYIVTHNHLLPDIDRAPGRFIYRHTIRLAADRGLHLSRHFAREILAPATNNVLESQ